MFLLLLYFSLALPSESAGMFSAIMLLIAPRYNFTKVVKNFRNYKYFKIY
jgi:hypothetical protein